MDILEKALQAHTEGKTTIRDNALQRAAQIGLLDPEMMFKTNVIKYACGMVPVSEVLDGRNFTAEDLNLIGWAGTLMLQTQPQLTLNLAVAMIGNGARFNVLALRAQALAGEIDLSLVSETPPRAVSRAIDASTGLAKAKLLAAAVLAAGMGDRAVEALQLLAQHEEFSRALDLAADVFAIDPTVEIAVAAAEVAAAAANREALKFWLQHCPDHETAFIGASTSPSQKRWSLAVESRLEAGIFDYRFASAFSAAISFGASPAQTTSWVETAQIEDPLVAARVATTLLSEGLKEEALNLCLRFAGDPACTLLIAAYEEEPGSQIPAVREVAKNQLASPAQVIESITYLIRHGQHPFGPLVAILSNPETSDEQVYKAADLLVEVVVKTGKGNTATGKAFLTASERSTAPTEKKAMWRYFAARCQVPSESLEATGNPAIDGWGHLAAAELASQQEDTGAFVLALSASHNSAVVSGNKLLMAAVQNCKDRFVR